MGRRGKRGMGLGFGHFFWPKPDLVISPEDLLVVGFHRTILRLLPLHNPDSPIRWKPGPRTPIIRQFLP